MKVFESFSNFYKNEKDEILDSFMDIFEDDIDNLEEDEINDLYDATEEESEDNDPAAEYIEIDDDSIIDETLIKKKIVKNGKKVIKITTNKPGYKVIGGKEVKMSHDEIKARKLGAKKRAKIMAKKTSTDKLKAAKKRAKTKKLNDRFR